MPNQTLDLTSSDIAIQLGQIAGWMDEQGLGRGPLEDCELLTGGTQNILVRFRRENRTYVLRRPPLSLRPNSNDTMRREARVLDALAGYDVPHPRMIAACLDEAVLGAVFYLMEPVDGFTATTGLPPLHAGRKEVRHRMGLAMVEAIAMLGRIDYKQVGLEGFGRPEGYLSRQVGRWKAQLESYADVSEWDGVGSIPGVDAVADWLNRHLPASFEPGILHGDYHMANVMFSHDSGELAAIVDWELSTIGAPLLDLGWLIATWPEGDQPRATDVSVEPWEGFPTAAELISQYRAHSTHDLSNLDWYIVLACYKLGIILEGTHARARAGKADQATGDRLHAHAVDLFERALRRIN